MFGAALRLVAAGVASQRLGGYVKNLTTKYLVLSVAGSIFLVAAIFGILAGFWALNTWTQNPIWSALIMLGILALAGFLTVLIAYGITREKPQSPRQALTDPMQAIQGQIPSMEDVGHQIEQAVRRYGPLRVAAAAAAGGLVAGLLAKRFGQVNVYEPRREQYASRRDRYNSRRYA